VVSGLLRQRNTSITILVPTIKGLSLALTRIPRKPGESLGCMRRVIKTMVSSHDTAGYRMGAKCTVG
jgi:hypothetical protein